MPKNEGHFGPRISEALQTLLNRSELDPMRGLIWQTRSGPLFTYSLGSQSVIIVGLINSGVITRIRRGVYRIEDRAEITRWIKYPPARTIKNWLKFTADKKRQLVPSTPITGDLSNAINHVFRCSVLDNDPEYFLLRVIQALANNLCVAKKKHSSD